MSTATGDRRTSLKHTRSLLYQIPLNELFELPGRPHVVYQLRSYSNHADEAEATMHARNDVPFLFKAFETGQIGPKRMAKMHGGKARVFTIHEYLNWTVTAQSTDADDELVRKLLHHLHGMKHDFRADGSVMQDFGGFRVLVILPRYTPQWPPAGYLGCQEGNQSSTGLGAPKKPLPLLQTHSKPVCAATIRSGPGYLEIPFVATHEGKRGRGYCRCLVQAIQEISQVLGLQKLMLCSTDDAMVKSTWLHLGFHFTSDEQMEEWDIPHSDLVYLQNTVQMHKVLPATSQGLLWKPVIIKHGDFRVRVYARIGEGRPALPPYQPPSKKQARGPLASASGGVLLPTYSSATSLAGLGPVAPTGSEASGSMFLNLAGVSGRCVSTMTGGSNLVDIEPCSSFQYPMADEPLLPQSEANGQEVDGRYGALQHQELPPQQML